MMFLVLLFLLTPIEKSELFLDLHHHSQAIQEIETAMVLEPQSKELHKAYIRALARSDNERALLLAFKKYLELFPNDASNSVVDESLVEEVAVSSIKNNATKSSPLLRITALEAAAQANDASAEQLVEEALNDSHVPIRLFSILLATQFRGAGCEKKLLQRAVTDPSPMVRQMCFEALGKMRCKKARPILEKQLQKAKSFKESELFIQALCQIQEGVTKEEVERFSHSENGYLRALCPALIFNYLHYDLLDLLPPLINDSSDQVKIATLLTLRMMGGHIPNDATRFLESPFYPLSLAAAFALHDEKTFEKWLSFSHQEERLQAAAFLSHTGPRGIQLSERWMERSADPFVVMNLALHLIKQRHEPLKAMKALESALSSTKEKLAFIEEGPFRYVGKNSTPHMVHIPRYPETIDLMTRLEIINTLASAGYPDTQVLIKKFFAEKSWGVAASSLLVLMQHHPDAALESMRSLLHNEALSVRLQAAIVLGLLAQEEEALQTLYHSFPEASRQIQEEILVAIGSIGAKSSTAFLTQQLLNPSPTLRLKAAGALLSVLYH